MLVDALLDQSEKIKKSRFETYATLSDKPPSSKADLYVLVIGQKHYEDGSFLVNRLSVSDGSRTKKKKKADVSFNKLKSKLKILKVDAAYVKKGSLTGVALNLLREKFRVVETFGASLLWLRKSNIK